MPIKTPFQQEAVTPQPFNLGNIPVHNITPVPSFLQKGYIGGTFPEALPPTGFQPQTLRDILSGIFPGGKK
jgi:hypothetical protein